MKLGITQFRCCQLRGFPPMSRGKHDINSELLGFMHGRRGNERKDSVTDDILLERKNHLDRLASLEEPSSHILKSLSRAGFGSKKRRNTFQSIVSASQDGAAIHLTSASKDWPLFKHILPEIAFAGHSNCGKSTLVNIMAGFPARKGPAGVSDRAGWTDQICFYQVGKKPPLLILADLPGYGHAVASSEDQRAWKLMTRDYLGRRVVLSRCSILVDCTRGLCSQDTSLIRFLNKSKIPWQVILTKCDLLSIEDLTKSVFCVERDLMTTFRIGTLHPWDHIDEAAVALNSEMSLHHRVDHQLVIPISSNTGAGIASLWQELFRVVKHTAVKLDPIQRASDEVDSLAAAAISRQETLVMKSVNKLLSGNKLPGADSLSIEGSSSHSSLGGGDSNGKIEESLLHHIFPKLQQREEQAAINHARRDSRVREHINAPLLRKSYFGHKALRSRESKKGSINFVKS